jgi:proton-dependent oligopeptide transporter, POT family
MKNTIRVNRFPRVFWVANVMELFERWAYYGVFALLSVYLTDPKSTGGLGFSSGQSGTLLAVVTFIIYFFPMVGGAIADRLGYRKVILFAFTILASGYFLMGQFYSYHGIFLSFLLVGMGAALFKPVIVGTISKSTNASNDTIGFGIFYMIVNIGAFIGPFVASKLRDIEWQYIFFMSTIVILINFAPLLTQYREPGRAERAPGIPFTEKLLEIGRNLVMVLFDLRFLLFVVIMSGFWVMYMQIFFTLPVYITQWVDTTVIYNSSEWLAWAIGTNKTGVGVIRPEMLQNLGAASIVFFQVLMSNLVKGIAPIRSITIGIFVSAIAMTCLSLGMNGWIIVMAIFFFALGEMISSPRTQEYVSRIAPPDRVGVYMGFSFLPVAFGNLIGGFLYGRLYGPMSDIYQFTLLELEKVGVPTAGLLAADDKSVILEAGMAHLGMTAPELRSYLYNLYEPFKIWWVYGAIGIGTVILFLIYNRLVKTGKLPVSVSK